MLSIPVSAGTLETSTDHIISRAEQGSSSYVCVANVHMLVTAKRNAALSSILGRATLVTSDGMPLVWSLRRQGYAQAERVYGLDLMICLCRRLERERLPVFFYGGSEHVARLMVARLERDYPGLIVAGVESPPLLPDTPALDEAMIRRINQSGARVVFVGLGCPKQEFWMHTHSPHIPAVLIGIGAAFDFFTGTKKSAPAWMKRSGLEWFWRLCSEPGRLWKRYLVTNSLFIWYSLIETCTGSGKFK